MQGGYVVIVGDAVKVDRVVSRTEDGIIEVEISGGGRRKIREDALLLLQDPKAPAAEAPGPPPRRGSRVRWSDLAFLVREAGLEYAEIDTIDISGLYYDAAGEIRNSSGAPIAIRATDAGVLID